MNKLAMKAEPVVITDHSVQRMERFLQHRRAQAFHDLSDVAAKEVEYVKRVLGGHGLEPPTALGDQLHLLRVRHDYFVSQLL